MPDGLSEDDVALNDAFRSALLADLAPRGALQEVVAERILIGLWRSLRGAGGERVRPRRLIVRWTEGEGGPEWHRVELDLETQWNSHCKSSWNTSTKSAPNATIRATAAQPSTPSRSSKSRDNSRS